MGSKEILQLAVDAGLVYKTSAGRYINPYISDVEMRGYVEGFANLLLEEAALTCDTNAIEMEFDDHAQGCRDCASDIRRMKIT